MNAEAQTEQLLWRVLDPIPYGSTVRVVVTERPPRAQRRLDHSARDQVSVELARELRSETGMPFWHALFTVGERSSTGVSTEVIRSALLHRDPRASGVIEVTRDDSTPLNLVKMAIPLRGTSSLSLLSEVVLPNGRSAYLPMLDFSTKSRSAGGEATVRAAVGGLGLQGMIVSSGRSYHFYGRRLIDRAEQLDMWAQALLLTPIVDERWIAHQMRAQVAALRVSANEDHVVPRFICMV